MDDVLLAIWNHIEKYDEEKNILKKLDCSYYKI
ncbi:DNA replication protein [Bacillus cereus FRI-35]|uniref:Uncharacterized protein n=1 Tax=Bacillus pacificus TaxID=2026187 RepID=A0A1Y5ZCF2_9BACI|nr:DNA replication protein [Bacillus cereus FRI-35]SMD93108.1 hypothetical protein BACERE00191_01880 [Bacillus pacificus]